MFDLFVKPHSFFISFEALVHETHTVYSKVAHLAEVIYHHDIFAEFYIHTNFKVADFK